MVFGMMAAVSQDLPAIYNFAQYKASKNSEIYDANGVPLGTLTSDQNKILLNSGQISPNVKNAVVAIEDARFYEHSGVDFQGIGRALVKDILSQSAAQGGSTITEQFVKNALEAQGTRTLFVKFKEAALAYRLERHWSKDKILTQYLNTIYFGEGAYGIEAAARTFFGDAHPGCGTPTEPCASVLEPWEAATLAASIASPSAYDPKVYPENSLGRRNLVLEKMYEQGYISEEQLEEGSKQALPSPDDDRAAVDRLQGALLHRLPAPAAGRTLRRLESLLRRPQSQVDARPRPAGSGAGSGQLLPRLLAGDRLGGRDRQPQRRHQGDGRRPRLRHRALQPGDPGPAPARLLDQALHPDHRPGRGDLAGNDVESAPNSEFPFGKNGQETFEVTQRRGLLRRLLLDHLRHDQLRQLDLRRSWRWKGWTARRSTTAPARSPATIHKIGYDDPISTNPAMVLGGLEIGVTPLGWTYAYSTIGNNGDRVSGTLAPRPGNSPVSYTQVTDQDDKTIKGGDNDSTHEQVIDQAATEEAKRHARNGRLREAPAPTPRSAPKASGARPGRRRTTATPGSAAASATKSPPASGSATRTRRRR